MAYQNSNSNLLIYTIYGYWISTNSRVQKVNYGRVQKYRLMGGATVQSFKLKGAKLADECIDTSDSRLRHMYKVQSAICCSQYGLL